MMIKRVIALSLVFVFVACFAIAEEKTTIPAPAYNFFITAAARGDDLVITAEPTIALNIDMMDAQGENWRFVCMTNYATFYTENGTYKLWPYVALIQVFCGLTERDAFMTWYDLAIADPGAQNTTLDLPDGWRADYQNKYGVRSLILTK